MTATDAQPAGQPIPTALDELQDMVTSTRQRYALQVTATVALLDTCAELGELAGAYLKHAGYAHQPAPTAADADPVRAEYGDVLFALLSFADAAGLSARSELAATLARYETRFAGDLSGDRHG